MEPRIELTHIVDQYIAVADVGDLNYEGMIDFIEEQSESVPTKKVSNLGGYQTEIYNLGESYPQFKEDYLKVGRIVSALGQEVFKNRVACDLSNSYGFFNKVTRGNSHVLHRHTGMICSILYLNDGQGFATTHFVVNTSYADTPLKNLNKNLFSAHNGGELAGINPKRGLLLMFPSHLLHRVSEHDSDASRYTFACNWNLIEVEQ